MTHHSNWGVGVGLLAVILAGGGCAARRPAAVEASVAECRVTLAELGKAMAAGDWARAEPHLSFAEEAEANHARAVVDWMGAAMRLDRRGREVFGERWPAVKSNVGLTIDASEMLLGDDGAVVLLSDRTAMVRGAKRDGTSSDVYLIERDGRWRVQAASLYDPKQTRAANTHVARTMADEWAKIADRLGKDVTTEADRQRANAEVLGLVMWGDRKAITWGEAKPAEATKVQEPVVIPAPSADGSFVGVTTRPAAK